MKIFQAVDPRVDQKVKDDALKTFVQKGPCCIGKCKLPLQRFLREKMRANKMMSCTKFIRQVSTKARTQTIHVEKLFKQAKVHASTTGGHAQNISTVSSNHVLSSAGAAHAQLRDEVLCDDKTVKVPKRRRSGWNAFLSAEAKLKPGAG